MFRVNGQTGNFSFEASQNADDVREVFLERFLYLLGFLTGDVDSDFVHHFVHHRVGLGGLRRTDSLKLFACKFIEKTLGDLAAG
jgi:hypothetical protein